MTIPMIMMMLVNLIYTVLALGLAIFAVRLIDEKIFTKIDFQEEIKKGNLAAAVLIAAMLVFIAIVVSAGLKG
ncbi:MAG TPA: DUF350 domain-containing protein [Candidatus Omnitrophota bacterium]|nr:DUF350 domain-containing protein [Candidatus Omnitrophota bacterium]HPB69238.1 DUF350 domain-containing protein [Candidatus Omnitrophota bacterium]HQO58917.1 DUF350 domain-containing protein [Candidatus Omnitrophota bacterium]